MATMVSAYNGQQMTAPALSAYNAMAAGFKAAGFGLLPITEAWRPDGDPSDVANAAGIVYQGKNIGRKTQWGFYNRYRRKLSGWTLAAVPGTAAARHRTGNAVDFGGRVASYGTAEKRWMDNNCGRYGFKATGNGFSIKEAWHFDYVGGGSAGSGAALINITAKLGADYARKLQTQLGVTADSVFGAGSNKALQKKLGVSQDGSFGNASVRALQSFVGASADGVWGAGTTASVKAAIDSGKFGSGSGKVEITAILGKDYAAKLQTQLGVTADSVFGAGSITALQKKTNSAADGVWGTNSTKALQTFVGVAADGIWGNGTTGSVKAAIDSGKFGTSVAFTGVTAKIGTEYSKNLQAQLGVTADGVFGVGSNTALQKKIGTAADGAWGTNSTKALQTFVGVSADGIWGDGTTNAVKAAIDAGKFRSATPAPTPTPVPPVTTTTPDTAPAGKMFGVDLAWPQTGAFDWATFKKNVGFAIIKAAGAEDPAPNNLYAPARMFETHYKNARAAGIPVGFYYFNNGSFNVEAQAKHFVDFVKGYIKPGDVVALDVEPDGSVPQFNAEQTLEFVTYVERELGMKTFIYMNRSSVNEYDWSDVAAEGHPLWLATLDGWAKHDVAVKYWDRWTINQFEVGTVGGYAGAIDRNVAYDDILVQYGFTVLPSEPEDAPTEPTEPAEGTSDEELKGLIQTLIDLLKKIFGVK